MIAAASTEDCTYDICRGDRSRSYLKTNFEKQFLNQITVKGMIPCMWWVNITNPIRATPSEMLWRSWLVRVSWFCVCSPIHYRPMGDVCIHSLWTILGTTQLFNFQWAFVCGKSKIHFQLRAEQIADLATTNKAKVHIIDKRLPRYEKAVCQKLFSCGVTYA